MINTKKYGRMFMAKRFVICHLSFIIVALASCKPEYIIYDDGRTYVMFSDTLLVYPVLQPVPGEEYSEPFSVPVVTTKSAKHDRNFGIEIVMEDTDAKYGFQYRLESSMVTIKAGEYTAEVKVRGRYDNLDKDDAAPVLKLRLVSTGTSSINWDVYGVETKVKLQKVCPFDINDFGGGEGDDRGYCLLYSEFLRGDNALASSGNYPRLIRTRTVPDEENTVVLESLFYDGYDIKVKFYPDDPLDRYMQLVGEQVIGTTALMFLDPTYGDGRVLVDNYPGLYSPVDACHKLVVNYVYLRVSNMAGGDLGGEGHYLEWITPTEAIDYL